MMPGNSGAAPASTPPTLLDAFDVAFPAYVNGAFGNIGTDDCVIAPRAHHTIP
jgi:hypothetical protein